TLAVTIHMTEEESYSNNILFFIGDIKGRIVREIIFDLDPNPTFDLSSFPFDFKYCLSVIVKTEEKLYRIYTAMTSGGFDTFWIIPLPESFIGENFPSRKLNSEIIDVNVFYGIENYAYKLAFKFKSTELFLYAAEIYDLADGSLDFKINDEMILAFEDKQNAEKFDQLIKNG
ncbi:hypothetical protein V9K67_27120, partial [Paraflavisolibacter sp. H34]|uniref:hypothetical protein n=1 Tax=Huijunlia imazamoxiresistens TaxID=3127457 RepID=UPI00301AF170